MLNTPYSLSELIVVVHIPYPLKEKAKETCVLSIPLFWDFSAGDLRQPTPVLLPRKSHGRRSLVGCSPRGRWGSDMTERLHFHFSLSCIGEGNGNPLQCSCLENPRNQGAWWAAVYGVAQGQTRLKWLSSSSSSAHITHKRHSGELSNYPTVFIFYWICLNYNWNFSKIVSVQNYLSVGSISSTNLVYT